MCYNDKGPYFKSGGAFKYWCGNDSRWDCNKDDYYSTLCVVNLTKCTADGNWLASNWNLAWSQYLGPVVTMTKTVTCRSTATTHRGDEGKDTINLNNTTDDVIQGMEGNDPDLHGAGGADYVCGGYGNDSLRGGTGIDDVRGGYGEDTLRGGGGDDVLRGGEGANDDVIYDGAGADTLYGGPGYDTVYRCDTLNTTPDQDIERFLGPDPSYC